MRASSAAALLLLSLAAPGLAESRLTVSAPHPVVLQPGERVAIRWHGLPEGVEETELLLSLDGGQRFSVRLTESLAPRAGYYEWTVPKLPSRQARLALRVGLEGREEISLESEQFEIAAGEPEPTGTILRVHRGELWALTTACGAPPDDGILPDSLDAPATFRAPIGPEKEALPATGAAVLCDPFARPQHFRPSIPSILPVRIVGSRPAFVSLPLRV